MLIINIVHETTITIVFVGRLTIITIITVTKTKVTGVIAIS